MAVFCKHHTTPWYDNVIYSMSLQRMGKTLQWHAGNCLKRAELLNINDEKKLKQLPCYCNIENQLWLSYSANNVGGGGLWSRRDPDTDVIATPHGVSGIQTTGQHLCQHQ
uniref:Uncharacterized protein n=1 Tax=Sphaerodactylus townsendi TaxID=933632 RepID=A0ACB8ERG7_9SAUR